MRGRPRFLQRGLNAADASMVAEALDLYASELEQPLAGAVQTPERRQKARNARNLREHLLVKLATANPNQ